MFSTEERAFFAWFDGLGYPDLREAPFITYRDGRWRKQGEGPPKAFVGHGFLLREDGNQFEVFDSNLHADTCERHQNADMPWEDVGFERADLERFVADGIAARKADRDAKDRRWYDRVDPFFTNVWPDYRWTWRLTVLARGAEAQGKSAAARALLDLAYEEGMDRDLAYAREGMAEESRFTLPHALVGPGKSDEERMAVLELWLRRYREIDDGAQVAADVEVLRGMIRERERRRRAPPSPRGSRAQEERFEAWIDELCDVADHPGERERAGRASFEDPDTALANAGLAAVPVLIWAVHDRRPTRRLAWLPRSKGWQRPVPYVERVGDLALALLMRVSGGAIEQKHLGVDPHMRLGPDVRDAAERWHDDVRERGEVTVLVERMQQNLFHALDGAWRLGELDPETAVTVLLPYLFGESPRSASEEDDAIAPPSMRESFAQALSEIDGFEATAALQEHLARESRPGRRVPLAWVMAQRGDERGLDALLEHWPWLLRGSAAREGQPDVAGEDADPPSAEAVELSDAQEFFSEVVDLFLDTDDVRTLAAVRSYAETGTPGERLHLVVRFIGRESARVVTSNGMCMIQRKPIDVPYGPAVQVELERLLASLLEDEFHAKGAVVEIDDVSVDPVIGQLAARALAERFPDRWQFDPAASPETRERMRRDAAQAWRTRAGR